MEILVCREEPFCEAVPAVAQLVDLVSAEGMDIRERNQLNSRRSIGVESRQLAARRGQRQRERLHAVAKEISAGQRVVRIETVIDLRDQAGQIVERRRNDGG